MEHDGVAGHRFAPAFHHRRFFVAGQRDGSEGQVVDQMVRQRLLFSVCGDFRFRLFAGDDDVAVAEHAADAAHPGFAEFAAVVRLFEFAVVLPVQEDRQAVAGENRIVFVHRDVADQQDLVVGHVDPHRIGGGADEIVFTGKFACHQFPRVA
ncbi:hypothetical protein SDC9_121372 [bioreactor metagenome]|uniref:Uncharacterized protein n=1 Tax=bioreactor metagenome TaxID=1076179 RepID=A0A645CBS6_9ZZZZ